MLKQIKKLEKTASLLEPSKSQRKKVRRKVIDYTEKFLNKIETSKAFVVTEQKGLELLDTPISEKPGKADEILKLVEKHVDTPGLNPASGGHLGYIPGGGIYYSALGDYMADITNRYAGIFFASPGAVRMENMLLEWMRKLIGYPDTASGNLTSGGSIANLTAIVTARDALKIRATDIPDTVIYLSKQAHHSVEKAIRIAGLKECILRFVPVDDNFAMLHESLENMIRADKKAGLKPKLVIASAGTTDVGAIDPLDAIGDIAKKHKMWYHIDAAYGGFFMLTSHGRKLMKGIEKSDSVIIDPHKGLFIPYGLGVVLIKDKKKLQQAHFYVANYMQDTLSAADELSPADLSPELTKHFRGMRLWLPLQLLGTKPFEAALEEKLWLARYFYKEVKKLGFETGSFPELSVVTYRYVPKKGDPDLFNKKLLNEIHNDGRVFVSSTLLNGKFTLRLAVLSFRTHLKTIDLTLKILKEKVKKLEKNSSD